MIREDDCWNVGNVLEFREGIINGKLRSVGFLFIKENDLQIKVG